MSPTRRGMDEELDCRMGDRVGCRKGDRVGCRKGDCAGCRMGDRIGDRGENLDEGVVVRDVDIIVPFTIESFDI